MPDVTEQKTELKRQYSYLREAMRLAHDSHKAECAKPVSERNREALDLLFELHCDLFEEAFAIQDQIAAMTGS